MSESTREILYLSGALACVLLGILTLGACKDILKNGARGVARYREAGYGLRRYFGGSGFSSRVDADGAVHFKSAPPPPPFL